MSNQRDVAQLANVSSATVSRYLSNPESVSEKTAARIREAITSISYKVDYAAQSLKTGRSNHIGILAPGIGPFYWETLYASQAFLNDNGYFSTLFYTRDVDSRTHSYRNMVPPFLQKRQLDGILFFPLLTSEDDVLLEQLSNWSHPFVVMDRPLANSPLHQVVIDNYGAGRQAAQSFIDRGHRDFLFIWGTRDSPAAGDRFQGFHDCLADNGIALDAKRQLNGEFWAPLTYQTVSECFTQLPHFTAVFASNDSSAIGFMRAASEHGMVCPTDYSIIGFDNNLEFVQQHIPSISTFRQPVRDFGVAAASTLLQLIAKNDAIPLKQTFKPEMIIRESLANAPKT